MPTAVIVVDAYLQCADECKQRAARVVVVVTCEVVRMKEEVNVVLRGDVVSVGCLVIVVLDSLGFGAISRTPRLR